MSLELLAHCDLWMNVMGYHGGLCIVPYNEFWAHWRWCWGPSPSLHPSQYLGLSLAPSVHLTKTGWINEYRSNIIFFTKYKNLGGSAHQIQSLDVWELSRNRFNMRSLAGHVEGYFLGWSFPSGRWNAGTLYSGNEATSQNFHLELLEVKRLWDNPP